MRNNKRKQINISFDSDSVLQDLTKKTLLNHKKSRKKVEMRENDKKLEILLITIEFENEKERIYCMVTKKISTVSNFLQGYKIMNENILSK